jgi:thiamine transporter
MASHDRCSPAGERGTVERERTRIIVEISLAVALAAVLNLLKIWRMPNAGTVSFVMLPIIVIALRRGLVVGLITGALYGFVDFVIDPYPPVHWIQPLLDYPIAYMAVGCAGIFSGAWHRAWNTGDRRGASLAVVAGCLVAGGLRYLVHVVSGAVFFAEYAPAGQPVWLYSSLYNLYVPLSTALAMTGALILMPVLARAVPIQGRET